jgi:hypothetical protein
LLAAYSLALACKATCQILDLAEPQGLDDSELGLAGFCR